MGSFASIFSEVLGEKEHDEIAIHISYMGDQLKESWGRFSCFRSKKTVPMIPSEKRRKTAK
ncbi:hypothetical protein [Neobacillus bataviensis]|uniref:hypothetical protein n=1 Tax=Neobacillus bataviensis TaxID=220685 RepID=UPI0011A3055C|nr:hypothetical protein [Neobacillus bataviensis]